MENKLFKPETLNVRQLKRLPQCILMGTNQDESASPIHQELASAPPPSLNMAKPPHLGKNV